MNNFINPIDLLISVVLLTIIGIGINNGTIIESKKNITLILSSFISSLIVNNIILNNSQIIKFITFFIILIIFLFLIGFICDLSIRRMPNILIDKNSDKLLGGILGLLKGLIIISILTFLIELVPIQETIKNKLFYKAKKDSTLFNVCDKIKEFIIY